MQTVHTRPSPSSSSPAAAWRGTGLASLVDDARFLALLAAYRASGGLATGPEIAARRPFGGLSVLARAIAAREVIGMEWGGQRWLPFFQFERGGVAVREPVRVLVAELRDLHDLHDLHGDWDLAQWFVQPNASLDGAQPLHLLDTDFPRVHDAARALRFACSN